MSGEVQQLITTMDVLVKKQFFLSTAGSNDEDASWPPHQPPSTPPVSGRGSKDRTSDGSLCYFLRAHCEIVQYFEAESAFAKTP